MYLLGIFTVQIAYSLIEKILVIKRITVDEASVNIAKSFLKEHNYNDDEKINILKKDKKPFC